MRARLLLGAHTRRLRETPAPRCSASPSLAQRSRPRGVDLVLREMRCLAQRNEPSATRPFFWAPSALIALFQPGAVARRAGVYGLATARSHSPRGWRRRVATSRRVVAFRRRSLNALSLYVRRSRRSRIESRLTPLSPGEAHRGRRDHIWLDGIERSRGPRQGLPLAQERVRALDGVDLEVQEGTGSAFSANGAGRRRRCHPARSCGPTAGARASWARRDARRASRPQADRPLVPSGCRETSRVARTLDFSDGSTLPSAEARRRADELLVQLRSITPRPCREDVLGGCGCARPRLCPVGRRVASFRLAYDGPRSAQPVGMWR